MINPFIGKDSKRNKSLLKNTVESIVKQDPDSSDYEWGHGFTIINRTESLFNHFHINYLLQELIRSKFFTRKFKNHKFILFLTEPFDKRFFKNKKTKFINFFSAFPFNKQPHETRLSIEEINKLHDKSCEYMVMLEFFKSMYYSEGITSELWYAAFNEMIDVYEKKRPNDIGDMVRLIEDFHKRHTKRWSNFGYVCKKYKLQEYFTQRASSLNQHLDNNRFIVFSISRGGDMLIDPVYPNVLNLLLYYVSEYLKNKNKKAVIIVDNIAPFISLQKSLGTDRLSDMFQLCNTSLESDSFFASKKRDYFFHKPCLIFLTKDLRLLGRIEEDRGGNFVAIMGINKKIIFEIDSRFFYLFQKYLNVKIDLISGLVRLGTEIRNFWDERHKKFPFFIGYYDEYSLSGEVNLNVAPIDFRKVDLDERLLLRMLKEESESIEFKRSYKECISKIIKNVIGFARRKGGDIIIGVNDKKIPIGIDLKSEGFDNFNKMIDSIYQKIADNISPELMIYVSRAMVWGKDFITITVWPGRRGIKYKNRDGKSWKRIGPRSIPFK